MRTPEFNEKFQLDRKARTGVRANPKNAESKSAEALTADGAIYDASQTYHFFDERSGETRQSLGFRRSGEYLCAFGLKIILISKLRLCRDDSLSDGQSFFKSEIERLQKRIQEFELEKSSENRSLKAFLMTKE